MKKLALLFALLIPVLLISQPCLPDGITFATQEEIDNFHTNFPDCSEIEGGVLIKGEDINNLNGLSVFVSIGGNLKIGNTILVSMNGLEELTSIGGDLSIGNWGGGVYSNDSLKNLNGLEGLTSIGGGLSIGHNDSLTSLGGLEGLTSIRGGLSINNNDALTSLAGLEGVTSIIGGLRVSYNNSLINLEGLDGLDSLGGSLVIYGNQALTSLTGLEGLLSIGGGLSIGYEIYGAGNPALTSLGALENLNTLGGHLTIVYNDSLSVCDVPFICNYLTDPPGEIEIHDNAPGCNSHLQLAYDCGITYECLTSGTYDFYSQGDIDYFPLVYTGCTNLEADVKITGNGITNLDSLYTINSIEGNLLISETYVSNFSGLENLSYIGDDLTIGYADYWWGCFGNPMLVSLNGLEGLDSIGGYFEISCNDALTNFTGLEGLTSVEGYLEIRDNDALSGLTGLGNIDAGSIEQLFIVDNIALTECAVQSICDYLATPDADVTITGNVDGCSNREEVEEACEAVSTVEYEDQSNSIQCYPNPFSGMTIIEYDLKSTGHVRLFIYNHLGEQVAELVNGHQTTSKHHIVWHPDNLQAGVYFCVLKTERGTKTTKMIKF